VRTSKSLSVGSVGISDFAANALGWSPLDTGTKTGIWLGTFNPLYYGYHDTVYVRSETNTVLYEIIDAEKIKLGTNPPIKLSKTGPTELVSLAVHSSYPVPNIKAVY